MRADYNLISVLIITAILVKYVVSEQFKNFVYNGTNIEIQNITSTSELIELLKSVSYYGRRQFDRELSYFTAMSLKNTKIEKIPENLFARFSQLQDLDAIDVQLSEINRDDFRSAGFLRNLDLSRNNLASLENVVFMYLKQVSALNLSNNQISSLHDGAFEEMSSNLIDIDLSFNKIEKFKENYFILMVKNAKNFSSINLESNNIDEIEQSNSSDATFSLKLLNLRNNKIKVFESSKMEIVELLLDDNQLERLNIKIVETLSVNNNKLKSLSISETMINVSANGNEIGELKCDKNLSIETLLMSGNKITNEVFLQLKHADKLKILDLSDTMLNVLSIDSFAEMKMLESLSLGNAKIMKISFGLFSHQQNLQFLNISHNDLGFIDYHMFTTLSNLTSWDISGNKLTKLKDYESFHEILPKLSSIGLEDNDWNCEYLSKVRLSLEKQGIKISNPIRPIKNESSIKGLRCSTKSNSRINQLADSDNGEKELEKLNEIVAVVNNLINEVNDLKSNQSVFKEIIFGIQTDLLRLKSENFKDQLSTANTTNINEVRTIVEQMNNMTLERQKLANDQLIHKINEQSLEIAKHKMEMEKLLLNAKSFNSFKNQPQTEARVDKPASNSTETVLIGLVMMLLILLLLLGFQYCKSSLKDKLNRLIHAKSSSTRRNSASTIATFDNSSV